jgi:hypothetical protein
VADQLRRIEKAGSTHPLVYAVRDARGVEAPAADPPDRRGFNEEAEWTRRAHASLYTQHGTGGLHGGWHFPRAIVLLSCDDQNRLWIDGAWRDGESLSLADPLVTIAVGGDVLVFRDPFATTKLAVQLEFPGRARAIVLSEREIRIAEFDRFIAAASGWYLSMAIYEAP